MIIRVFPSSVAAAMALAARVIAALRDQPHLVLGLPTGRTPVLFYRELVRGLRQERLACSHLVTFNLDEFCGVGPQDPGSYRQYMERHLFKPLGLDPGRVNFLNGLAPDTDAECRRYEQAIQAAGGIDLQILGIGANGHVGFNEPGDWLVTCCHRVTLRPETRRANAGLFGGDLDSVPREALTMGIGTILRARRIVLLATGHEKARATARAVAGPLATEVPASLLQLHPDVELMLDEAAASRLPATSR